MVGNIHVTKIGNAVRVSPFRAALSRPARKAVRGFAASEVMGGRDTSQSLSLDSIRGALIRQEDTIIFSLIERAQFARNAPVYACDAIALPGFDGETSSATLLQWLLRETEHSHAKVRRYTSPDEHPFYPEGMPQLVLPPLQYPNNPLVPQAKSININDKIMDMYLNTILPGITDDDDDGNYGSAALCDVAALQALSKRIHYGKYVAEAKFRQQRQRYESLIRARDEQGIMDTLTDVAQEARVVQRVLRKAATYGRDLDTDDADGDGVEYKLMPDTVARLYADWVMPLTKEVQVAYLLQRLDAEP